MNIQHPQETITKTYDYKGIIVELVEWSDTVWCGKVGYADNHTDEPNVEKIMKDFMSVSAIPDSREDNWDICMSLNYLSDERPTGRQRQGNRRGEDPRPFPSGQAAGSGLRRRQ